MPADPGHANPAAEKRHMTGSIAIDAMTRHCAVLALSFHLQCHKSRIVALSVSHPQGVRVEVCEKGV